MVAITAVELNYIILRYLTESEFLHTAFMFDCEARVSQSPVGPVYGNSIPPAVLVKLVQKGLQYMEMEENLKKGENDVDKDFSFLQPMDLIKKVEEDEMQHIVTDKKKNQPQTKAVKLAGKGKARKVWEREEDDRKARKKEEADRKARKKEEADRKARKKEEADRKARKKEEADRKARKKEEADRKAREKEEADTKGEDRSERRIRIKIKKR